MTKRAFGELELTVLRVLKSGQRMTVKEVHKILGETDNYNTIMTVMLRLSQKNILGRERTGHQYEYWLIPNKQEVPSLFKQIKQTIIGFKSTELISYLIESDNKLSAEELNEMERIIQKAKEERQKKESE